DREERRVRGGHEADEQPQATSRAGAQKQIVPAARPEQRHAVGQDPRERLEVPGERADREERRHGVAGGVQVGLQQVLERKLEHRWLRERGGEDARADEHRPPAERRPPGLWLRPRDEWHREQDCQPNQKRCYAIQTDLMLTNSRMPYSESSRP